MIAFKYIWFKSFTTFRIIQPNASTFYIKNRITNFLNIQ